jgi:hypothetical protein
MESGWNWFSRVPSDGVWHYVEILVLDQRGIGYLNEAQTIRE